MKLLEQSVALPVTVMTITIVTASSPFSRFAMRTMNLSENENECHLYSIPNSSQFEKTI